MVSIYIPTHNRSALLKRALRSVFSQTYRNYEIIVVDDGSTDGTPNFLERLAVQGRIRMFRFESARGAQAARNYALANARFDLVTGLDDDDEWLPDRLQRLVEAMRPSVGFVAATDVMELEDNIRYLAKRPIRITRDMLLRRNVVGNQVLARKADFLSCGAFDESLPASQDYDLWIRLSAVAGDGVGLSEPLQIVHAQASRVRVTTSTRRKQGVWRVYCKHRASMSADQRKSHLFNVLRTTERRITFRRALALWGREDAFRIFTHWLRGHGLITDVWLERIASFRDRAKISAVLVRHNSSTSWDDDL